MAGGPQDGQRFVRNFYEARMTPPAMRSEDGKVCCPIATHTTTDASRCVVVHPNATDEQIERAVDSMVSDPP